MDTGCECSWFKLYRVSWGRSKVNQTMQVNVGLGEFLDSSRRGSAAQLAWWKQWIQGRGRSEVDRGTQTKSYGAQAGTEVLPNWQGENMGFKVGVDPRWIKLRKQMLGGVEFLDSSWRESALRLTNAKQMIQWLGTTVGVRGLCCDALACQRVRAPVGGS